MNNIIGSLVCQVVVYNATALFQIVSWKTSFTGTIFPGLTVLHHTAVVVELILFWASCALKVVHIKASFNFTVISLESEVGKAVSALSSLVSDTSSLHSFADSLGSQEVSTFTGHTFIVIVGLAVLDFAVSIFKFVRFITFLANMINFIFAS